MPRVTAMDRIQAFIKRALIAFTQALPVQNTWYEACDLSGGLMINYIRVEQDNDAAAAENIEVRATIDGVLHTLGPWAPASGLAQYLYIATAGNNFTISAPVINAKYGDSLECHAFKLEIRSTVVPGAGKDIYAWVQYEEKEFV